MHFLYIAVCFGCLFKIMRLYYPPKKPGYHSIIKTKDFIANAMSLILIGTTYIVEPLLKLCGVLHIHCWTEVDEVMQEEMEKI